MIGIRVLGPLEADVDGVPADLGGPRQRCVLARLIAERGRVVSADRLIEDLYADEAPPRALAALQSYVSRLRHELEPDRAARGPARVLVTAPPGYAVRLEAGDVDAWAFEDDVHQAAVLEDPAAAHARLSAALARWRGQAFGEFRGLLWADLEAARLDELRLTAAEARAQAALRLGRAAQTVAELSQLTTEYPLREEAWRLFALALYQSGRQGDALAALRRARARLATDLGIDPSPDLRELEGGILAQDPHLAAPSRPQSAATGSDAGSGLSARRPVPRLLPADIADFTGRAEQIRQIRSHLIRTAGDDARLAVPVMVVVTGPGGVGKTSLAVHAAHGLAARYPDGQLFADMHAGTGQPLGPARVLERFLRALGVPGPQVPEDLDERAEVYRDLMAGRKVLVVLDDVAGESAVRPLLPGTQATAVLITSRHRLGGLDGAAHIELGVLDARSSLELLGRIAGTGRVRAQSRAAAAVAEQCGHLPLALRVAGARLAERPHWDIQQLADRLADETRRLDELRHGDLAVRASISLSYGGASEQARRLLRRLALVEAPAFSGWVAAALLDRPPAAGEDVLDELVTARLVETTGTGSGVHGQYRLHDLIRVYARERLAADEPPEEQNAALQRALGALLYLAREAEHRYHGYRDTRMHSDATLWPLPGPLTRQLVSEPMAWFERERAALVRGVRQAAGAGFTDLCWDSAFTAATLFEIRCHFDDWRETHEIALNAARLAGHVRGQATILYALGSLHLRQGQFQAAGEELATAARLFRDAADDRGTAIVTVQLVYLERLSGRLDDAVRHGQQALPVLRSTGDLKDLAVLLKNLGQVKLDRGELEDAKDLLAEAIRLARAAGSAETEASVLSWLGQAYLLAGELDRAAGTLDLALAKARDASSPWTEAHVLVSAGILKTRLGEFGQARTALQRALQLAGTLGERLAETIALRGLGELALATGDPGQAVTLVQRAVSAFRELGAAPDEARALAVLGDAHAALGDNDEADAARARASALRASFTTRAPIA